MHRTTIIPLDLNESYWLLDDETLALIRNMPRSALATYPEYQDLQKDLATYLGVSTGSICLTPGSDEAIRAAVKFCARKKYRSLVVLPTFSGYERVLMEIPLEHERLYYGEVDGRFVFPLDEVLTAIESRGIAALFLCEPNNPLGTTLGSDYRKILDAAKKAQVLVMTDEAYFEFGGESALDRIETQSIIVLRTLSKAFGVPAIRVGCAIASEEIAEQLREIIFSTLPWPISGPSVHVARTVLGRANVLTDRRKALIDERGLFLKSLQDVPQVRTYPSLTNFILLRVPYAPEIAAHMLKDGIRVGEASKKTWDEGARRVLDSTLRLTVPAPEHRTMVLDSLKAAVDKYRQN